MSAPTAGPAPMAASSDGPVALSFEVIAARLRELLEHSDLAHVEAVVAVARGGVVAGALVAYHLGLPLHVVRSRYRDDANSPLGERPVLTDVPPELRGRHVLVVDDVSVSGATLRAICVHLDTPTTTLVLKGRSGAADLVVFDDVPSCVHWPWRLPDEPVGDTSFQH